MSEAIVERTEDEVTVLWPSAHVGMRFSGFHDSMREGPYAELAIHNLDTDLNGVPCLDGLLKRARLALLGARSQDPIVKALLLTDHQIDWAHLIESSCNRAVDAFRTVTPGIDLADVAATAERPWLIQRLLPAGESTMIYADGESGKSLIALAVSLSVVTGRAVLPGFAPVGTGSVVYLDWETNRVTHRRRLDTLCRGLEIAVPRGIFYQPMHAPLSRVGPEVRALLRRRQATLAVVDSMGFAAEGDVMGPDGALGVFRALRGWGGTVLALHHMSKEEANKEYGAAESYGSIYFRNSVRMSWELRSTQLPHSVRRMALYQRKDNDGERAELPLGFQLYWDKETQTTAIGSFQVSGDQALAGHGGLTYLLQSTLRQHQGALTVKEIAEITGLEAKRVADTLRHDARFVRLVAGGGRGNEAQWGLAHVSR